MATLTKQIITHKRAKSSPIPKQLLEDTEDLELLAIQTTQNIFNNLYQSIEDLILDSLTPDKAFSERYRRLLHVCNGTADKPLTRKRRLEYLRLKIRKDLNDSKESLLEKEEIDKLILTMKQHNVRVILRRNSRKKLNEMIKQALDDCKRAKTTFIHSNITNQAYWNKSYRNRKIIPNYDNWNLVQAEFDKLMTSNAKEEEKKEKLGSSYLQSNTSEQPLNYYEDVVKARIVQSSVQINKSSSKRTQSTTTKSRNFEATFHYKKLQLAQRKAHSKLTRRNFIKSSVVELYSKRINVKKSVIKDWVNTRIYKESQGEVYKPIIYGVLSEQALERGNRNKVEATLFALSNELGIRYKPAPTNIRTVFIINEL